MQRPRPHRRNRRKPAANTRGGPITNVNVLILVAQLDTTHVTLQMVLTDNHQQAIGYDLELPVEPKQIPLIGWVYREAGQTKSLASVTADLSGLITVTFSDARAAEGTLMVAPFLEALRGQSGSVSAGGAILIPAPATHGHV